MKVLALALTLIVSSSTMAKTKQKSRKTKKSDDQGVYYVYPKSYNEKSKSSIGLKSFTAKIGSGILYGWRHVNYNSEKFFIGGAGFTGQMGADEEVGTFSYGGLIMGYDKALGKYFNLDYGLLAGGGGGKFTNLTTDETTSGGGVVIEPWLAFNWKIGRTTDFNLAFSQINMPNNEDFTGSTVALRFDFVLQ